MAGYGTDQGFTDWATANGHTVPAGTIAAARQRGSNYIDGTYGERFSGVPVGGLSQERAWPRTGATDMWGNAISEAAVPDRVVHASYEAALLELTTAGSLAAVTSDNEKLRRMKAGSVELEYAAGSKSSIEGAVPMSTAIEGLLRPLIGTSRPLPAVLVV